MQCPTHRGEKAEVVFAYLGRHLSPEAAREFELHTEQCPECREALDSQRAVSEALEEWMPEPVSADFDRRLLARLAREERLGWRLGLVRQRWLSLRPAVAAAAAALAVAAGLLLRGPGTPAPLAAPAADTVDIEQLYRTVEDLDMLYLLDPELSEEAPEEQAPQEKEAGVLGPARGRKTCA